MLPAFDADQQLGFFPEVGAPLCGLPAQVSPAPATATFTDVPTSDFAFQFIEAFNAAGITVGCNASPPQFCPDRNVTRREMAVFFAKALGLRSLQRRSKNRRSALPLRLPPSPTR